MAPPAPSGLASPLQALSDQFHQKIDQLGTSVGQVKDTGGVAIQQLADQAYARLKQDPRHPSLHFKKIGRFWSARVGAHYRALAVEATDGLV